jgi:hypothetical protein
MLAFNMETRDVIFVKDYWRADVDGMEKEGEIYALPESKGVPNIQTRRGQAGQGIWCSSGSTGCPWISSLGI